MRRSRLLTDMSVATRLSVVALLVTLLSLAVAATVGLRRGNELADGLTEDRLTTLVASRTASVEAYLTSVRGELAGLAISPATSSAIRSLTDAYLELSVGRVSAAESDALTEYYLTNVVPDLEAARSGPVNGSFLIPRGPAAVHLQAAYTIPQEAGDDGAEIAPVFVVDAGDGTTYSETHAVVHPVLGEIAVSSGFDDVYLISTRADAIVYSVRKRTDFATSLGAGPLSGSALANLVESIRDDPVAGSAAVVDYSAYSPAGDEPRMFVGSPVFDDGTLVGYIAASLTTDPLDRIMSGNGSWAVFGDTGDAYIVGPDGTMRTTTRAFVESPREFTAPPEEPGVDVRSSQQRRRIIATGTTALVQPVSRQQIVAAESGPGVARVENYRGIEAVVAFRTAEVDGLDWVVVAEVSTEEFDRSIENYARNMIFAVAFFVVAVTFVAVRWSDRLIAPIRSISARLRTVTAGGVDAVDVADGVPDDSPHEYLDLAAHIDDMLDRVRERSDVVAARSEERARLVAQFLPAAAAQRRQAGDEVIDHVRAASVAVLSLDGVGALFEGLTEDDQRDLLGDMVDELDDLAADFGLERVKFTGTSYFAVCGVVRPYLDHAPRTVGFALAAAELVADLARERDIDLSLSAGVGTGAVAVGLSGRAGLVYDAWGAAVDDATDLARRSAGGTVSVSAAVREQLPNDVVVTDSGDGTGASVVAARVSEASA